MYIIDSHYIRKTLQAKLEERRTTASYKYIDIIQELEKYHDWPPSPTKTSNLTEAFVRMDTAHAHRAADSDQNLLCSTSGSYMTQSLRSTGSVKVSSGSKTGSSDEDIQVGSFGIEQHETSMAEIFPYLTKTEDTDVQRYGNVERSLQISQQVDLVSGNSGTGESDRTANIASSGGHLPCEFDVCDTLDIESRDVYVQPGHVLAVEQTLSLSVDKSTPFKYVDPAGVDKNSQHALSD